MPCRSCDEQGVECVPRTIVAPDGWTMSTMPAPDAGDHLAYGTDPTVSREDHDRRAADWFARMKSRSQLEIRVSADAVARSVFELQRIDPATYDCPTHGRTVPFSFVLATGQRYERCALCVGEWLHATFPAPRGA